MHFDLFYELALPPSRELTESRAYADALAEIELGEALGFHAAWLVEHHFMRGYSHSRSPSWCSPRRRSARAASASATR